MGACVATLCGVVAAHPSPEARQDAGVSCSTTGFPHPEVYGTQILALTATPVTNDTLPGVNVTFAGAAWVELSYCNVSIEYTHPGLDDKIHVEVWLPLKDHWNGRFLGIGGGGFATGYPRELRILGFLYNGLGANFSTVYTDGGHAVPTLAQPYDDPAKWGLASPGVTDWTRFNDYASIALNDAALLGKAVTADYYGRPPRYAYFNGCSTGGRQGHMLAQRYPTAYDGILSASPAVHLPSLQGPMMWPQIVMNQEGVAPHPCELAAITEAAIEACDDLDGLKDGVISNSVDCTYNATDAVGRTYNCSGTNVTVTAAAALVANAFWAGPSSPEFQWYGYSRDSPMNIQANTSCSGGDDKTAAQTCVPAPASLPVDWFRVFIYRNASFDASKLSYQEFGRANQLSVDIYTSPIGSDDPDLRAFDEAGGKLLVWHGLQDEYIPVRGTRQYHDQVLGVDPNATDYYRYFEAPGTMHCAPGTGPYPFSSFEALVDWVENGRAPDTIPATIYGEDGVIVRQQPLCLYPLVAAYVGPDPSLMTSWECRQHF